MTFPKTSNANMAALDNSSIPALAENGQAYVVGSPKGGINIQVGSITPAGTSVAVSFSALGLEDMANTSYRVFVGGEHTTTAPHLDVSTKALTGFTLINCTSAEPVDFMVVGRVANTRDDASNL